MGISSDAKSETRLLALAVLSAAATRLYSLLSTKGYLHPDNLFQVLEPAHRLVFGYGITPWEYVYGMRSWLMPLLASAVFRIGLGVGIADMNPLIFMNRAVSTLFSLALLLVVYEAALTFYNRRAAIYSLIFAAFSGVLWWWSADINTNIPAALYCMAALTLFYRGHLDGRTRNHFTAGLALGVAFMFRYDSMIFLLPLTIFALHTRRLSSMPPFAAGLALMVLLQGLFDYLAWGSFLHSPVTFLKLNIIAHENNLFGSLPFYFYIGVLGLHLTCLMVLPYSFERQKSFAFLSLNASVFFLLYSVVPYKEIRLVIPALPPFLIICGRGMERAVEFYGRAFSYSLIPATVILGFFVASELGWQSDWAEARAMNFVGGRADATGVAYEMPWPHSGGYTYLHKKIPMVTLDHSIIDPMMTRSKCDAVDTGLIEFQCGDIDGVLVQEKINFFVVAENGTAEKRLLSAGFKEMADFDGIVVYKRP